MRMTKRINDRIPESERQCICPACRGACVGSARRRQVRVRRRVPHGNAAVKTRMPWRADDSFSVRTRVAVRLMARSLLPAALLWVSACSQGQDMNTTTDTPTEEGGPLRKLNPAPKRGYVITMTLKDAPGPFASIEGVAQYTVENSAECGKKIPIAGVFPRISTNEPFVLTRVSESEYRGIVYADLVLD